MSILGPNGMPVPPSTPSSGRTFTFGVQRADLGTLEVGHIMQYRVMVDPTHPILVIAASRRGVEIEGHMPPIQSGGMASVMKLLRRAIRQHEVLASAKDGERQLVLTEEELDSMDTADAFGHRPQTATRPAGVVAFPTGESTPPGGSVS